MKMLYFAWLRTRIGAGSEEVTPPAEVADVGALVDWLKGRGPGYAEAFEDMSLVRVAVNHEHVGLDHPVKAGDQVAMFPPVTGG